MANSLLIIEDEALLGAELKRHYARTGWDVTLADSIASARHQIVSQGLAPLVVLSDMSLPDGNSLDLLDELREQERGSEWIFLTGYGSVPDSVRALQLGAYDFLEKPCDFERIDVVVAGAARSAKAQRRLHDRLAAATSRYSPESYVGSSPAAQNVRNMLQKLTQVPYTAIVITGETGTGKGVAARVLHHCGTRREGPMIEINCSALPRELLESELFGHEAGAFTGAKGRRRGLIEQADGGTLFLDEITEMDLDLQSKLLKAIEDRRFYRVGGEREIKVDVQITAASNRDLDACVRDGSFRADLYHRLSVFKLALPPLRGRKEDITDLIPLFVGEFNAKAGKNVRVIPDEVWSRVRGYDWPGNVRELRNVVERCVLFADGEEFPLQWLQLGAAAPPPHEAAAGGGGGSDSGADGLTIPLDGSMALDDMDRYIIETVLVRTDGNVAAAARALGTTRDTLRYRIRKYGLQMEKA